MPLGIFFFLIPLGIRLYFCQTFTQNDLTFFAYFLGIISPPIFGPKNPFFVLQLSPSSFFWPEKSFYSLKLVNFWTLFSIFSPILARKILFFCLSSAPAFFCQKIGQFLDNILIFFPIFCPKNLFFLLKLRPSLFFFDPESPFFSFFF